MIRPRFNPRVESLEDRLAPATFTVTSIANGGTGSLREAITLANTTVGADVIDFNISGTGVQRINLRAALPQITEQVTIDATTQPGFAAFPIVSLNGAATRGANGLVVAASANNSVIRGLIIQRFDLHGIVLQSDGNTVQTNFIGTNPAGTNAAGNGGSGIAILGDSSGNTIGGIGGSDLTVGGLQNLISGNAGHGVLLKGAGVTGNLVSGNFIGTTAQADTDGFFGAIPNGFNGININRGANNNTVGVVDPLNTILTFIAGNNGQGINIAGAGTTGNTVIHAVIGSNLGSGIRITGTASGNTIGGSDEGEANIISGNRGNGVLITGAGTTSNTVLGNLIGTDQDGLLDVGNGGNGVTINLGASGNTIGGTAQFEGNVISGNGRNGVNISGADGNTVAGNIIGANATGTAAIANGLSGVQIGGGSTGNTIGGTTVDALNLISGNAQHGVNIKSAGTSGNAVIGNAIGTNLAEDAALANGRHGVVIGAGARGNTIGGPTVPEGNLISGNARVGVLVQASQTVIQANKIGTAGDGTSDLGNGRQGVFVTNRAQNTLIGGTGASEFNIIAHNDLQGVLIGRDPARGFLIAAGNGNAVLGNSIFSNALLGIDLNGGANRRQAAPTITSATIVAGIATVNVTLTSRPNTTFRIEFFTNAAADPSGSGEGQTFLGFIDVTTDGTGTGSGTGIFLTTATPGTFITATATNLDTNDTSEFSVAVQAT